LGGHLLEGLAKVKVDCGDLVSRGNGENNLFDDGGKTECPSKGALCVFRGVKGKKPRLKNLGDQSKRMHKTRGKRGNEKTGPRTTKRT